MFNTLNGTKKHGFPTKHVFLPYTKRNPRRRIPGFCPPKSLLPATQWRSKTLQQFLVRFFVCLSPEKKRSKGPYMEFDPTHFLEWSHNKWHPGRLAWNLRLHPWKREKSSEQSHYFTLFSASMWIFGGVYHIEKTLLTLRPAEPPVEFGIPKSPEVIQLPQLPPREGRPSPPGTRPATPGTTCPKSWQISVSLGCIHGRWRVVPGGVGDICIRVFPKIVVPQNGWWKSWKTLILNGMIWGENPLFSETSVYFWQLALTKMMGFEDHSLFWGRSFFFSGPMSVKLLGSALPTQTMHYLIPPKMGNLMTPGGAFCNTYNSKGVPWCDVILLQFVKLWKQKKIVPYLSTLSTIN